MKTAIQQCAQDLFETDLSHEAKTKIVDILHTHLTTEKEQIKEAYRTGEKNIDFPALHGQGKLSDCDKYFIETFIDYNQAE